MNPGNQSAALYGEAAGVGDGKVYGLYVVNTSTDGNLDRWAGFFEDKVTVNQPTVEINSRSQEYGLKVTGGKKAGIVGFGTNSGPGVYALAARAGGFTNTYGIYGEAGGTNDPESSASYGVYGNGADGVGVVGDGKASGTGIKAIAEGGVSLIAENKNNGYAAKFKGLVDAGSEGFFLDGTAFLGNYVFAATRGGAVAIGTMQLQEKLTVAGGGDFEGDLNSSKINLTDQLATDQRTRYPLSVEYSGLSVPRLCVETTSGGSCTEFTKTCTSEGTAGFRTLDDGSCAAKCSHVSVVPTDYLCRWSCTGKIGYDDCSRLGDPLVSGSETCTSKDGYYFEGDSLAPLNNCFCKFKGPGEDYQQAKFTGGYDKRCIDFSTNIVP